jgi:hypothetical protein
MPVVESAYGVEGGALGQHTWHTWCPLLINRYKVAMHKPKFIAACSLAYAVAVVFSYNHQKGVLT